MVAFFVVHCTSKSSQPSADISAESSKNTYQGIGKDSLPAEVIQKFAAKPLGPELSRKLQNMLDVRSPGMGLLSPNKREIYFTWKVTGTTQLWKLESPKSFPIQMTGGEDQTSVVGIDPLGKFLILSRDRAGEENPGLYLQSTQGGELQVIQHKEKIQTLFEFITEDGKYIYYRSNELSPDSYAIYKYNVKTKKSELIFSEKGYWRVTDYRPDGRLLLQKVISNVASEIYEWNPKAQFLKSIIGQGENEEHSVSYAPTENEYFVLTNKLGEFRKLYLLKGTKLLPVTEEISHDVSAFSLDHPKKHLVYTINEAGFTRIKAMDARTLRSIKLPPFPGADHIFPGLSSIDGEVLMLGVISSQSPRTSYSYDWKTGKLTQWVVPSAPEVDLRKFAVASLEHYITRDGVKIPMFVRRPVECLPARPAKAAKTPCPVVVHFHGGPESQSEAGFSVVAQMFVNEGFVFVDPNVRGSDGYGKTWLHLDDGPKRLSVITDIPDAAQWIRQNWSVGGVAPKIGVMGWSYGGYSAQMAMTKFAGSFDAGVALVGMSSLRTFLQNTAPYRRALRVVEYGDPEKDAEALDQLSAMKYIDQIKSPLLLIQGVSDPRVPAGEAVQMYEAMKAKGLDTDLILFADEGHGSQKRSNQVLELGHTLQFFKKNLGYP
jgi:dipeptidyl aminopeptidase/acylaminoacyl peptidase